MKLFNIKIKTIFIIFFSFVAIAATKQDIYRKIKDSQRTINSVYKYLITHYVDDIDLEKFTKMSIDNMLSDLDPYTVYLVDDQKSNLDMLTKGKYGGVGIQIGKRDDVITVIAPTEDSPAKRAGIMAGDILIKIDGNDTKSMSMDDAAKLIRGKEGTDVILTIERFNEGVPLDFILTREDIPVKDVSYYGMLDETIGYIRLNRFSKNSAIEVEKAITSLSNNNLSSIVLDLRDNPGGLLNSAVSILDMFIEKDELLVWTAGKARQSNKKYFSKSDPIVSDDIQIAVLINGGSASASEIVAGVIQDLDRGIVVGRQSFGKGLVQTVYNLDRNKALKITTAKYYIPSGRLIQRDGYLPEEILADTVTADSLFETVGGRLVKGGKGITPDYVIENDERKPILFASLRKGLFFSYVQKNKHLYDSFEGVKNDPVLISKIENYIMSHEEDLDIKLDGENNYLDARGKLMLLDSNDISITGAIDLLDSYFEEKAITQFDREKNDINEWMLMEFAKHFDGEQGRMSVSKTIDNDISKAMSILEDPFTYRDVFIQ
ncbi:S41 family peptidase [bacterium]|jgi:carboxyl-terminal processing protease|nr:S41 family peptidase [bacterium]MBT6777685.1 S41 family peptidase [bacterium]